jgi:FkbM family methyltransferase
MTPRVPPTGRFGRRLRRLFAIARNPLSVIPLLLLRRIDWRTDFRVGRLILSARRADLGAISEIAIEDEYGFVKQLAFPGSDALVLDIGANMGCFSALVLSTCPDAEVHSVEPSPDTFALLSENRARYPKLRWHTHQSAIAADSGTLQFQNDGPSTARKLSPIGGGVVVKTEAFDSFVTRVASSRRIFLCKMDIEGAEIPIFSGAMNTLAQIDHFIIEVHGPAANAILVTNRLSATFAHVEAIPGRRSAKPMIHAWRAERTASA